jgi:Domain of unknown function (DUF1905)/Bacteriocin-protection, YdeI or OmpD-Associated
MDIEKPIVDKLFLLEKFPGKGGWTYAQIPEILHSKINSLGWLKVKGSIDDYEFIDYKLMPMGNGRLFLPVKSEIRKQIGKQAGDWVHLVIYADIAPAVTLSDFLDCLKDDPIAYENFLKLTESKQNEYTDWIFSVKTDDAKVERIAKILNQLSV